MADQPHRPARDDDAPAGQAVPPVTPSSPFRRLDYSRPLDEQRGYENRVYPLTPAGPQATLRHADINHVPLDDETRPIRPVLLGAGAIALVVLLGSFGYLLLGRTPDSAAPAPAASAAVTAAPMLPEEIVQPAPATTQPLPTTPAPTPTSAPAPSGSPTAIVTQSDSRRRGSASRGDNLAPAARVVADHTSPDGVDGTGQPITYAASNLTDHDLRTAWRMDGDGTGSSITLTFPAAVRVAGVGMTNGYTKVDPGSGHEDRYAQERRILTVTWTLDGGRPFTQTLTDGDRTVQHLTLPAAATARTIRLHIVSTTSPGDRARDKTAITEITVYSG